MAVDRLAERRSQDGGHVAVQEARPVEGAQDRIDPPRPVHVFDVVVRRRSHLADVRCLPRQPIDVGHREVDAGLVGNGEDVQDGVRRSAHGDVEHHGVFERLASGNAAWQDRVVALQVVGARHLDDAFPRLYEEVPARPMRGQHGTVAGQGEAQRLVEAVHAVGREHAGAGAAGRTGRSFELGESRVVHVRICGGDHGVDQIDGGQRVSGRVTRSDRRPGLHRSSRDEDGRQVEPHSCHQHARRDLVAVRDAQEGVGDVRLHHVLDAVGDEVTTRQRVQHPAVTHRDAVVDGDGVELDPVAAGLVDDPFHTLADVVQVHVPRHELREAVGDGNDGLVEILVAHPGGPPQGTRARHVPAVRGRSTAKSIHGRGALHRFRLSRQPLLAEAQAPARPSWSRA